MTRIPNRPISATELMAALEKDDDYQRVTEAANLAREQLEREDAEAERPVLAALAAVGVQVDSIWDLSSDGQAYSAALPILMEHLEKGGYADRVTEGLGRLLAVRPAVAYWDRLKALYLSPRSAWEEEATAIALSGCATLAQLDDLIGFLSLEERGESRIYFIRPILRLGRERGWAVVESLMSHPQLGKEATARVKGRRSSRRS